MKSRGIAVFILVLALLVAGFSVVSAQDNTPQDPPNLEDPTDLRAVVTWLASGGGGAFVALWVEKQKWFQELGADNKKFVVVVFIGGLAIASKLLLDFIPEPVWVVIAPYFTVVMTAVLVGYPVSQLFHFTVNKHPE